MNKSSSFEYFESRGIKLSPSIIEAIQNKASSSEFSLFTVNGYDYMLDHFLDDSDQTGYGIIPTNEVLKTEDINAVAFALVEGDDVLCINISDESVFLWLVQSDAGKKFIIAKDVETFLAMI